MVSSQELADDLAAETADLVALLEPLPTGDWELPTPAPGWAIRDQVSHLAFFDDAAMRAITDPDAFRAEFAKMLAAGTIDPDTIAEQLRDRTAKQLLEWFGRSRAALVQELAVRDPKERAPWYGPDMSIASMTTARLMETWAHGQDVADAVGVSRVPTKRLRHVAHLGVRTMGFSFLLRDRPAPTEPVRVELEWSDGLWAWGPEDAADRVTGPALDFCLLVTQRRHLADTRISVHGPVATEWLSIAQAFAGAPGKGRPAGLFPA
ncbi:TIGR03084 family metal-binding protein [Fodinicola feengrottensis]|uniref:TIGR03084 family metal-binding protein n=1 Tax=Fodinicola feengrottensis TaxID=435914 RepID=A0ABN2GV37_9ACTN